DRAARTLRRYRARAQGTADQLSPGGGGGRCAAGGKPCHARARSVSLNRDPASAAGTVGSSGARLCASSPGARRARTEVLEAGSGGDSGRFAGGGPDVDRGAGYGGDLAAPSPLTTPRFPALRAIPDQVRVKLFP